MRYGDVSRILHNKKATRTTLGKGEPSTREGNNGDMTIREITGKGIFLFVKYNNNWYSRVLFDGAAEIGMQNPGKKFQLFGWNPDSKAYQLIDSSDVLSIEFGSPGKMGLKLGTSGATSLNEVDDDIDLSDTSITSYAIDTSVIEDGNTLTVGSGVEFAVSPIFSPITDRRGNAITSIADIQDDITNLNNDISTVQNNINSVNSDLVSLDSITDNILSQVSYGGTILGAITSLQGAFESLRTELLNLELIEDNPSTTTTSEN